MNYRSALASACAAVLVTLAARVVCAAEIPAKCFFDKMGGAGYLAVGIRQLKLGPLNEKLAAAGYSSIGQTFATLGGGGLLMIGRLRLGVEGHSLIRLGDEASRANGTASARLTGGYGMFRLGVDVISYEHFSLYPMVGVGGGALSVRIWERSVQDFGQVLSDPSREASMTRGGLLLDAAIGTDYRIPIVRKEKGEGFMLVGLRASYSFSPVQGAWSSSAGSITGGPDIGISGPSLQLIIGFGGLGSLCKARF